MTETEKYLQHFPGAKLVKRSRPTCCPLKGCRQQVRTKGLLCSRHNMRLWRKLNPLNAHFAQIRDRAVRRGQVFTLTLQQFKDAVAGTGYLEGRGRSATCLHLDRIDATRGYEPGNVRVITARENCQKSVQERRQKHVDAKLGVGQTENDENPF